MIRAPLGSAVAIIVSTHFLAGCLEADGGSVSRGDMDRYFKSAIALQRPGYPNASRLTEVKGTGAAVYLGFDIDADAVRPGSSVRFKHYLRVEEGFSKEHDVLVELENAAGVRLVADRHAPVEGRAPAQRWRGGQIWADVHRLDVPTSSVTPELKLFVSLVGPDGNANVRPVSQPEAPAQARVEAATIRIAAQAR